MVTESPRTTAPTDGELLARAETLRADADLMDAYARRLTATAAALGTCPAAPDPSRPALARQAAACTTAADRLRTAAEALLAHITRPRPRPRPRPRSGRV